MEMAFSKPHLQLHEYELVDDPTVNDPTVHAPPTFATASTSCGPIIEHNTSTFSGVSSRNVWHSLLRFLAHNPVLLASLLLGAAGAFACFAFTFWLSLQVFECPSWTVNCELHSSVRFFTARLGLVQGILSSIYGICIAGIVYASYQLAETTLWPVLCHSTLTLRGVDRFLAHARGSLPSFPMALWRTRHPSEGIVVMVVGILGLLLHVNSALVGWAFTVLPVATTLQSNHSMGGAMGFGFSQQNPPAPFNGELQRASSMYSAWSSGQSDEMLPGLREYILDRNNFTSIGNFTVGAVQATRQTRCYGAPLGLVDDTSYLPDMYVVATNFSGNADVWLRLAPGAFTSWVDSFVEVTPTSAKTTIKFAAVNSTFEGGEVNTELAGYCEDYFGATCLGISSLACDVTIDLKQSQACSGVCAEITDPDASNVTWIGEYGGISISGNYVDIWGLAVAIAASATQLGPFIYGAQPVFQIPAPLNSSTLPLPIAWSDASYYSPAQHYTQANLTNFLDVAAGAMSIAIPQGWPGASTTIDTTVDLLRMMPSRTFTLLIPPSIAIGSVFVLLLLTAIMHRRTGILAFRLGWSSEIVLSAVQGDLLAVAADEGLYQLTEEQQIAALERKKLRLRTMEGGWQALLVQSDGTKYSQI